MTSELNGIYQKRLHYPEVTAMAAKACKIRTEPWVFLKQQKPPEKKVVEDIDEKKVLKKLLNDDKPKPAVRLERRRETSLDRLKSNNN